MTRKFCACFSKRMDIEEAFMSVIRNKKIPARFVMLGAMIGAVIIVFMPDHLEVLLFGDLGALSIITVFAAVVASTAITAIMETKKEPEVFDKKRVNSILIRVALIVFVVILINHLLRAFWPAVHYSSTGAIMIPIIGLLAFVIASIPAARRRGWGRLWF